MDHIPDKWKNLRLEYTDEYINYLKEIRIKKRSIPPPKIMKKPDSILKNQLDVNKESHRLKEKKHQKKDVLVINLNVRFYDSYIDNSKSVILGLKYWIDFFRSSKS